MASIFNIAYNRGIEILSIKSMLSTLMLALVISLLPIEKVNSTVLRQMTLSVDYSVTAPVNLNKYGVNGALLGARFGYASDELIGFYKQTGIVFSRFPGGTIGNYYNWNAGNFSCYKTPGKQSVKRIDRMNGTLAKKKFPYRIDDFIEFVKITGSDFTYMLNALCGSPESNSNLLSYMKEKNVPLNYIEIANEAYSPSYAWMFKDAKSYIKSAEENYSAIKQNYPKAKIGLVVSPISFSGKNDPGKHGEPNKSWPVKQQQFDLNSASSQLADALIIHLYGHPYNQKLTFFDPKTYEEHFQKVVDQFNRKFHKSMDYLKSLGKGKPIWVTEWGVTAPHEKRHGIFRKYKKSAYQALFMASVLISITLEPEIEIANYHNITDFWYETKSGLKITPLANVLKLFINSARNSDRAYGAYISSDGSEPIKNKSGLKSIYFTSDTHSYILLVNEQGVKHTINKLDTVFRQYKTYSLEEMSIYKDEFMFTKKEKLQLSSSDKIEIDVRPYSILRINLEK